MTSSERPKGATPSEEGVVTIFRQGRHSKPAAALMEQIRQSMIAASAEEDDDASLEE
jgi:hypothetical protein